MTELTALDIQNNNILLNDEKSQNILSSMIKLSSLAFSNNGQVNISVINNLTNLKTIYLLQKDEIELNLKDIEDIISNLVELRCNNLTFQTILNCDVDKITSIKIAYSTIKTIPDLSKFTKLKTLAIRYNSVSADYSYIANLSQLENLDLSGNDMHGKMFDFSKLTNLKTLNLSGNNLWSDELSYLTGLKNNKNMTIDLSSNSIIDASSLLELDPTTKINLTKNVNLSAESKTTLKERFGSNVTF